MGCIYQIWTLELVRDKNQIRANKKDMDEAIIFRLRYFKNVVSPCRQELRSLNIDKTRFRGTNSIKDTHREKALLNKTPVLTKNRNMGIWVVGTSNQLFTRDC